VAAFMLALKPQAFREAGPALKPLCRCSDARRLDHGGHDDGLARQKSWAAMSCARCPTRRLRSGACITGCRVAAKECQRCNRARRGRRPLARYRFGRMGSAKKKA